MCIRDSVKVKENWDEDRGVYRDMGLDWVD